MWLTVEECDGSIYADAILTPQEITRIKEGEMITAEVIFRKRKCYAGIRLQGAWDYEEEVGREGQSRKSDARVQRRETSQRVKKRPRSYKQKTGSSHSAF